MSAAPRLSLGRASVLSSSADVALILTALLTTPFLLSRLGTEEYGVLAILTILSGQLGVLQLGLGPALTRRIAELRGRGEPAPTVAAGQAGLILGALSALAIGVAFLLLSHTAWRQGFRSSPEVASAALAATAAGAVVAALAPLSSVTQGLLMGEERFGFAAALRFVHGTLRLGAAVATVAAGGRIRSVLLAQAAVDAAAIVAAAWRTGALRWRAVTLPEIRAAAGSLLAIGAPFAVTGLLFAFLNDGEKLAIALAQSVTDLTHYTVPFNVASRTALFSSVLWGLLIPRLSRLLAEGDSRTAAEIAGRATRIPMAFLVAPLAFLIALAPELLEAWLGAEFAARSTGVARILLVGSLLAASVQPASAVLWARAKPRTIVALQAAEIPLHFVVVYVLVRAWGIEGAAVAWGVRVAVDGLLCRWLAAREMGRPFVGEGQIWSIVAPLGAFAAVAHGSTFAASPLVRLGLAVLVAAITLARLDRNDWHAIQNSLRPHGANARKSEPGFTSGDE